MCFYIPCVSVKLCSPYLWESSSFLPSDLKIPALPWFSQERSISTFPPQELGLDDHRFPTHLHRPQVLPTAGLKGKPPLTGDSTLHVTWAFRGTVHHIRMIKQQWYTAALLPAGLMDRAEDDRNKSILDWLQISRQQQGLGIFLWKVPLNQRELFFSKTYIESITTFCITWNHVTWNKQEGYQLTSSEWLTDFPWLFQNKMVTEQGGECPKSSGWHQKWLDQRNEMLKCLTTNSFGSQIIRADPGQELILGGPDWVRHQPFSCLIPEGPAEGSGYLRWQKKQHLFTGWSGNISDNCHHSTTNHWKSALANQKLSPWQEEETCI